MKQKFIWFKIFVFTFEPTMSPYYILPYKVEVIKHFYILPIPLKKGHGLLPTCILYNIQTNKFYIYIPCRQFYLINITRVFGHSNIMRTEMRFSVF